MRSGEDSILMSIGHFSLLLSKLFIFHCSLHKVQVLCVIVNKGIASMLVSILKIFKIWTPNQTGFFL